MTQAPAPSLSGLPELDAVALGIGDPAEAADAFHLLDFVDYVGAVLAELQEHGVQVADPEVHHRLLGTSAEIVGPDLERGKYSDACFLVPHAVLIGIETEAFPIPGTQSCWVSSSDEVTTDSEYAFHVAIFSLWAAGGVPVASGIVAHEVVVVRLGEGWRQADVVSVIGALAVARVVRHPPKSAVTVARSITVAATPPTIFVPLRFLRPLTLLLRCISIPINDQPVATHRLA